MEEAEPCTIHGSIIQSPGYDCSYSGWAFTLGYNLGSDQSSALTSSSDQANTAAALLPLADNGGPTRTHLPVAGSAGVDDIPAGTAGLCDATSPIDQRGVARPVNGACDIGAVEGSTSGPVPPLALVVDTAVDEPDDDPGNAICHIAGGGCSLRAAIDEANAWPGADLLAGSAAGVNPTLSRPGVNDNLNATGDLDVTDGPTIDGQGAVIDGAGIDRVLEKQRDVVLNLSDLTITGADAGASDLWYDGGLRSMGPLTLTDAVVRNSVGGAGIYHGNGSLTVERRPTSSSTPSEQRAHLLAAASSLRAAAPSTSTSSPRPPGMRSTRRCSLRLREEADNLAGMKVSDTPWDAFERYLLEGFDIFVGPGVAHPSRTVGGCGSEPCPHSRRHSPEKVSAVVREPSEEGAGQTRGHPREDGVVPTNRRAETRDRLERRPGAAGRPTRRFATSTNPRAAELVRWLEDGSS